MAKEKKAGAGEAPSFVMASYAADLRASFDFFDPQGVGRIDSKYLAVALRALGFHPQREELSALLAEADPSGSGRLDFDGFSRAILRRVNERDGRPEILASFAALDQGGKGFLDAADLRVAADRLHWDLTDAEIREIIEEASGEDGVRISQEAFSRLMRKTSLM